MESLGMNNAFWKGKSVFITGHTGFKGSWLCLWLTSIGARVTGYSLAPSSSPSLYELARIDDLVDSHISDIREYDTLAAAITASSPEIVFHLAAQPIVRNSYKTPVETYTTNVMGTVNVLEAVRGCPSVRAVVNVTTDKCYENREWVWSYRENEPLGGVDPYSSSKACSEIVTSAYRHSFFDGTNTAVATARAGNVIGGGDWATDRLIPDFFRAIDSGEKLVIRSPEAIRPWQHVLEPLAGYLMLAERMYSDHTGFSHSWNFGPGDQDARSVRWIVECLSSLRTGINWECTNSQQPHEARHLKLDSSKARTILGWQPRWNIESALLKTVEWHQAWRRDADMREVTLRQIDSYLERLS